MSDDTASDTSADPLVNNSTEALRNFTDSVLDALQALDADADQIAEVKATRDEALAARESEGPSLAEQINELEAEIEEHTVHKLVIRRVLTAHGLSDDQVESLLTDMEAVSEKLRADDEDTDSASE